ncbi:MAG: class I SAM-dependent methyltransferase, partial [Brachymonas sp.]|nr:class I SAM-dependent methyltransferase [Brachymonas sp.]
MPSAARLPAAARTCLKLLSKLKFGSLSVQLPDGSVQRFGQSHAKEGLQASLVLHNWNVCAAALKSGDIGFAEGYIAGDWSTPDLTQLLRIFIANRKQVEDVIYGTWMGRLAYRIKHLLNRNTKANSQKNIHAHYDLGNRFYEQWLDNSMSYSSAWFEGDQTKPMIDAQHAKVRRALRMAGVKPYDRVLEIGCGWGGLVEMAAKEFNANITGVTLSTEQLAFAQQRVDRTGCASHADLRLQDYRDIADQPFDAICSIEMVEAVGREFWPQYFETVARLLKSGGKACIQAITIDDALFDRYVKSTDFIQQYIFPGGYIPSLSEVVPMIEKAGLVITDVEILRLHYAETLKAWRERFIARREEAQRLTDERFCRMWEF